MGRPTLALLAGLLLTAGASGWKIAAWTWTGVKPHPAK
jgi:hypothetical protein